MAKFDYKKWVTENKYGPLKEQAATATEYCPCQWYNTTNNTCDPVGAGVAGANPPPGYYNSNYAFINIGASSTQGSSALSTPQAGDIFCSGVMVGGVGSINTGNINDCTGNSGNYAQVVISVGGGGGGTQGANRALLDPSTSCGFAGPVVENDCHGYLEFELCNDPSGQYPVGQMIGIGTLANLATGDPCLTCNGSICTQTDIDEGFDLGSYGPAGSYLPYAGMTGKLASYAGPISSNNIMDFSPQPCLGTIDSNIIHGCTDSNATNYDPTATMDDGSCNFGYRIDAGGCLPCAQAHPTCGPDPTCGLGTESYNCVYDSAVPGGSICIDPGDGTGQYATLTACQQGCTSTDTNQGGIDPVLDMEACCEWCNAQTGGTPPTGCYDWVCADCPEPTKPSGEDPGEEPTNQDDRIREIKEIKNLIRKAVKKLMTESKLTEGKKCKTDADCDFGTLGKAKCVDGECGEIVISTTGPGTTKK